jgi:hypothetical protein
LRRLERSKRLKRTVAIAIGNRVTVMGPSFRVAILAPVYWKAHIRLTTTSTRKYHVGRLSRRAPLSFIAVSFDCRLAAAAPPWQRPTP